MVNPEKVEPTSVGRAPYRSALRDAQASQTRERVLDAAAELFSAAGYLRTTMRHVADAAGVSVETVYAQGPKQSLLLASVDRALAGDAERVPLIERAPYADALDQASADAVLHALAVALTDIAERAAGLLVAFEDVASADGRGPDAAARRARRRARDRRVVAHALAPARAAPPRRRLDPGPGGRLGGRRRDVPAPPGAPRTPCVTTGAPGAPTAPSRGWSRPDPLTTYAVLSDVTRVGGRSPECRSATWESGAPGAVGSTFRGRNRAGWLARWSRRCEVLRAEPGVAFEFRTVPERWDVSRQDSTTWTYRLSAVGDGTRVVHGYRPSDSGTARQGSA